MSNTLKHKPLVNVPATARKTESASRDTVQSLSRALRLLNVIAANDQGLALSDAARATGLAVSTAHRLLTTLQQDRFVRFDPERSAWIIGVQAFIVGNGFLRSREMTAIARPLMRQLMERSGETVNLAIEDRGEAVYVAQVECRKLMRAIARPGGRSLMHCSGVGKALLAAMPPDDVDKIVTTHGLPRETDKTIDSAAKLKTEIEKIRRQGYAVDDEEHAVGLRCIAAAIYNEHGQPIAGLSLSWPLARIGNDAIAGLGDAVMDIAARITASLGGYKPRA